MPRLIPFLFLLCMTSCLEWQDPFKGRQRYQNQMAEYIERSHGETLYTAEQPEIQPPLETPWNTTSFTKNRPLPITRHFFRCRGNTLHPPRILSRDEKNKFTLLDCGGYGEHSLPLRENEEWIAPILIELLNDIQDKTNKQVVITSGHRCPTHQKYIELPHDPRANKHQIGAAATFYVTGFEESPETILDLIVAFYQGPHDAPYSPQEKTFTAIPSSSPDRRILQNKEIRITIYHKEAAREGDQDHPYAYLVLEVLYDRQKQEPITTPTEQATKNYWRW